MKYYPLLEKEKLVVSTLMHYAKAFMCSIEGSLKSQGKLSEFYHHKVNDTRLVRMPDQAEATVLLDTLNHACRAVSFTLVQFLNRAQCVKTKVYVKPTNTGLLLHYHEICLY